MVDEFSNRMALYPKELQKRALVIQCFIFDAAVLFPAVKRAVVSDSLFMYTPRRVVKFIWRMSDFSHLIVILSNCVIGLRFPIVGKSVARIKQW